jgi:hypothetical protein
MKVKAIYKWVSNTRYQQIIVSNQIEPNYESYVVGKRVFLMNTSQWLYKTAKWNFWSEFTSDALQWWSFETSWDFPLRGTLEVSDGSSSKTIDIVLQKDVINEKRLERSKTWLEVFTFPSGIWQSKIVINSESDPFYIIATSPKSGVTFWIDTDLSQDTNLNGDPADDIDNLWTESENSWSPYLVKFIRETQSQKIIRVSLYDSTKRVIASQDITLQLNFVNETAKKAQQKASTGSWEVVWKEYSAQDKLLLEKLKELVRQAPEEERLRLQVFVWDLQEEWFDARDKLRILLDIEAFVDASKMDKKVKESIFVHLQSMLLSDSTTKDELTTSLKIISDLLPKTNPQYQSVMDMLKEIQSHPNDLNSNKKLATSILDIVKVDTAMSVKEKKIVQQQLKNVIYWW